MVNWGAEEKKALKVVVFYYGAYHRVLLSDQYLWSASLQTVRLLHGSGDHSSPISRADIKIVSFYFPAKCIDTEINCIFPYDQYDTEINWSFHI